MSDNNDYEKFTAEHIRKDGKTRAVYGKYFPNRQIATISETTEIGATIEGRIVKQGMTKAEIERYFPPSKYKKSKFFDFNLRQLIPSIIYEAYMKEGKNLELSPTKRHFWYTHFKPLFLKIMGLKDDHNLQSEIEECWTILVEGDMVSYEEMNILSDKERGRMSVVKDSPYPNIIIAIEKMNYFRLVNWLPQLFNCTLMTTGGEPSLGVIRRFFGELKDLDVDLDQTFHVCTVTDLDPAGDDIEKTTKHKVETAIAHYGGTGDVKIHRLFVKKEQVSDDLLEAQGIPYICTSDKPVAKKIHETLWKKFVKNTGGLFFSDGKRAIVETDAFSIDIIERTLIRELLSIIREYNLDETKIMIPEIMRVFKEIQLEIEPEIYENYDDELIQPLRDKFENKLSDWRNEINIEKTDSKDEINKAYNSALTMKEEEKEERVPELYAEKADYETERAIIEGEEERRVDISRGHYNRLIAELERQRDSKTSEIRKEYVDIFSEIDEKIDEIDEQIDEECTDIDEEIEKLETLRDEKLTEADSDFDFRMEKYDEFVENHLAMFNPIEEKLRESIHNKIDELDVRYRDLEQRDETRNALSYCYTDSSLLLEENVSVFEHSSPAFKGRNDYLERAAKAKYLNIGKVRDKLPVALLDGMKQVFRTDMKDVIFELEDKEVVDMPDLENEIEETKIKIEKDIEGKK